jgi:predicted RNA-binding Zn ribbon-like protein
MALDLGRSPAGRMKLLGGDPALDFVNTVGGRLVQGAHGRSRVRDDKLGSYADLVAFAAHRGILADAVARRLLRRAGSRPRAARAVLERALTFREALHRTLRAVVERRRPASVDLGVVDAEARAARTREALVPSRDDGVRWAWRDPARALDAPLWPVARAAAGLLTSAETARLHTCDGDGCGWLFLDRSRSGRRRWCSMEDCGNLDKVRRFRRRRARGASGSP